MRIIALLPFLLGIAAINAGEIHDACEKGDVDRVKKLLGEDKMRLESLGDSKRTPIHFAAEHSSEVLKVLIESGADVHALDSMGYPPIFYAANSRQRSEMLERAGANIKYVAKHKLVAGTETTYIQVAASARSNRAETLQLALERGFDVSGKNQAGQEQSLTPLDFAAIAGIAENIEFLIAKGAAINKSKSAFSALHWAAARNRPDAVAVLLKHGADPNGKEEGGMTPLFLCAMPGGGPEAAKILLDAKVDPNVRVNGITPLGWNIRSLKTEKDKTLRKKREELSELLRKYGAIE